jgi:hypothetical protein
MTKPRGKGKPFQKGEDPRRIHGRQDEQVNEFAREMKSGGRLCATTSPISASTSSARSAT